MSDIEEQREYYERIMDEVDAEYRRRIADLKAENSKLRDLCSFLYRIHAAGQEWQGGEPYRIVKARMEELGVDA